MEDKRLGNLLDSLVGKGPPITPENQKCLDQAIEKMALVAKWLSTPEEIPVDKSAIALIMSHALIDNPILVTVPTDDFALIVQTAYYLGRYDGTH